MSADVLSVTMLTSLPLVPLSTEAHDRLAGAAAARPRPSRDAYGLSLARSAALRAACTRRQVGACILGPDGRVVSMGYNGTAPGAVECTDGGCPRGALSTAECPSNLGNSGHPVPCVARHAEANAIEWAMRLVHAGVIHSLADCTIYVSVPTGPCPDCLRLIRGVGLRLRVAS